MKIRNFLNILKKDQNGAVIIIVAFLMTVFMGVSALVLDLGIRYIDKSNLQKALDSSALAAVRELPITKKSEWTDLESVAKNFAELNGIKDKENLEIIPLDVNRNPINVEITNTNAKDINGIQVVKDAEVKYYFAKFFGINEGVISADATAELLTVEGVSGLLPVAISKSAFDYLFSHPELDKTIKFDGNDNKELGLPGWRGAVNFLNEDNTTATDGKYQDSIIDGYEGVVVVDKDNVSLNPGTMTVNNLPTKYNDHTNCYYFEGKVYKPNSLGVIVECINCPRLATIPIIDFEPTYDAEGKIMNVQNKLSEVIGIANVWITDITEKIIVASVISDEYVVNGARAGNVANDYGVRAAKLVD